METPHEDMNLDFEVLYTMNIDTQEVNIVVDKESIEKTDVATEPPTRNVGVENIRIGEQQKTEGSNEPPDTGKAETTDVHTVASTEAPTTTKTNKPIGSPIVDSTEVNKEKSAVDTTMKSSEAQIEKPLEKQALSKENTEKQVEQQAPS